MHGWPVTPTERHTRWRRGEAHRFTAMVCARLLREGAYCSDQ
jgi:hypothetical protein